MPQPRSIHDLETPALLVEGETLEANLRRMAAISREAGATLRPHVKTHKCPAIALLQMRYGSPGICCAKVSEARVFAEAGCPDILVAYPLIGSKGIALRELRETYGTQVATVTDSTQCVEDLSSAWGSANEPLPVLVQIDVGYRRAGLRVEDPEAVRLLAEKIERAPCLRFGGILTHAGHAYLASSPQEVGEIGVHEGRSMAALAERLTDLGTRVETVSVGSTPTAVHAIRQKGVTELRAGNYVFHDAIQVGLGVAPLEWCALRVWSTVVSHPSPDRALCDAGSKTFSSDTIRAGALAGRHGMVCAGTREQEPRIELVKLSEEHGWLRVSPDRPIEVGDRLGIVPAHACVAVNLARELWVVEGERVVDRWPVAARCRST